MGCMQGKSKEVKIDNKVRRLISRDGREFSVSLDGIQSNYSMSQHLRINKGQFIQGYDHDPYDKYNRIEVLGEGSYGRVYKVIQKETGCIRAIKEIKKIKKTHSEQEKLIKEINILKYLDHPNIVKIYEFYNAENYFYIVTEFCEGGELFNRIIQMKYFTEKLAAYVMKQLLSAVRFFHEHNIIHRDLKPENILMESSDHFFKIKVIDFGTGEIKKSKDFLTKQIGTPYYIAPEVLSYKYNEKCDIWSCGIIMYILLSGCPPFYGKNDDEIFESIKNKKLFFKQPIWNEVSDSAKSLIKSLLEYDFNKRPSAEKAMDHKWFQQFKSPEENETDIFSSFASPRSQDINLKEAMKNLKNFKAERKLQQASLYFMVHNLSPNSKDIIKLRTIFEQIDENNDGKIAKEELIKGFKKSHAGPCSEEELNLIMNRIDMDKSGYIEYQEFLLAAMDTKKLLTEENLLYAFNMFDKDMNGKISAEELKFVLGVGNEKSDKRVWKKIIDNIDSDGDGEISFEEFKKMMNALINII
jgi:calcium-dependent protein kinase